MIPVYRLGRKSGLTMITPTVVHYGIGGKYATDVTVVKKIRGGEKLLIGT